MSKESARQFIETTERDAGLQAKLAKGDWESLRAVASEAGFDLTAEDFHSALGEIKKARPGVEAHFGTVEADVPGIGRRR